MYRLLTTAPLLVASAWAFPHSAQSQRYDYIIVGGGTSGLVVANRLSELKNVSVAVIEAGDSVYSNENVTDTAGYGLAFGTSIDWQYESTPQLYTSNQTKVLRAGKALGGTSTINGMAYTRAEDAQIDVWETLGNDGWNWKELFPYYLKHETLQIPTTAQVNDGAAYITSDHGYTGPLKVGWTYEMSNITVPSILNKTYENLGVPYSPDVNGGKMRGYTLFPKTIDAALDVREDAARAFYFPYQNRTNFVLYLNTIAQKIVWSDSADSEVTASGVEVVDSNGTSRIIYANREVVLSAGALKSSVLLELSGIGNPSILNENGIEVNVDLPAVGENLQDQTNNGIIANSPTTFSGQYGYVAYPNVEDVFDNETTAIAANVKKSLQAYAEAASQVSNGVISTENIEKFFQIQYDLIFKNKIPIAEVLVSPSGSAIDSEFWGLLPFSRGNIHVSKTNESSQGFTVNPNYYQFGWDTTQQVGVAKYIRKIFATEPFSDLVGTETTPGFATVPQNATDSVWGDWIKANYRSNFHPVGTTAMMPKESGGVVDSNLLVYGTSNVRVVDAGVLPFQVCGHLVSTLYAVAEKAADIIKAAA